MPSCFVCKRSRNNISRSKNITFHKFPSNHIIRDKWYDFVIENGLNADNVNENSLLCSRHFHESMFYNHRNTKFLFENAVPIIRVSRVANSKIVYPEMYKIGQSNNYFLEEVSVLDENSPVKLLANEIGCEQLLISAEQSLQKKPNIVVAGNDMCEEVLVLDENSPVKLPANEIGCEQLLISAEQSLQKKPNIVVAGNDMCEEVSVLEENSPVKVDCINFNVLGLGSTVFHFTTKKHILLAKIMNIYCEKSGFAFNAVKFNFDGRAINEMDTPTSLDLVDSDTIEVFQRQNGSGYF